MVNERRTTEVSLACGTLSREMERLRLALAGREALPAPREGR